MDKILNPSTPSECVAAMSLSDDGADIPYLSLFFTTNGDRIRFFALEPGGTETVTVEGEESERLLYPRDDGSQTSNPDEAQVLVSGTLESGTMTLDTVDQYNIVLETPEQAVNFIQAIRYIYTMEARPEVAS